MKLLAIHEITGKITLKSGLHIGAGDIAMHIGGTDNPVIRHPHTQDPFIPGSSLKGKVRSLLELRSGLVKFGNGDPLSLKTISECNDQDQKEKGMQILRLFGTSGSEDSEHEQLGQLGPTRVSFGDAWLDQDWRKETLQNGLPLFEVKSENSINRIRGTAISPRQTERVPEGAVFCFTIALKQFENDTGLKELLLQGLKLLQMDALGGNGSRGYGRVALCFDDSVIRERFEQTQPF